jgi:8-oxo-dGTP pyrophosphatase MutT (NUDIX family)
MRVKEASARSTPAAEAPNCARKAASTRASSSLGGGDSGPTEAAEAEAEAEARGRRGGAAAQRAWRAWRTGAGAARRGAKHAGAAGADAARMAAAKEEGAQRQREKSGGARFLTTRLTRPDDVACRSAAHAAAAPPPRVRADALAPQPRAQRCMRALRAASALTSTHAAATPVLLRHCRTSGMALPPPPPWQPSGEAPKLLTLVMPREPGRVLLGLKKRGFGAGFFNGFGGKVEPSDACVASAAARELQEESGLEAPHGALRRCGTLVFHFDDQPRPWRVAVYDVRAWRGAPEESDEMAPRWFDEADIPYGARAGRGTRVRALYGGAAVHTT